MNSFPRTKIAVFGQGNQDTEIPIQERFGQLKAIFPFKTAHWDNLDMAMTSNSSSVFFNIIYLCSRSPTCEASKRDALKLPPKKLQDSAVPTRTSSCIPWATCQDSQAEAPWSKLRFGHCGKTAQPGLAEASGRKPWASLCKSSNWKLLHVLPVPTFQLWLCPRLTYYKVLGLSLHPFHSTKHIAVKQASRDAQGGELCSTAAVCCCTCQGWTTHSNIPSCSISRPSHLGDCTPWREHRLVTSSPGTQLSSHWLLTCSITMC